MRELEERTDKGETFAVTRAASRSAVAICLAIAAGLLEGRAAASCPSDREAVARTKALESSLIAEGYRARRWRYAWGLLRETLALGSFGMLPIVKRDSRADSLVGGSAVLFSGALTLAWPLEVESSARDLQNGSKLAPCERLQYAERLVLRYAEDEAKRSGFRSHLFAIAGAAAVGGVIAIGLHHVPNGIMRGAFGLILGEAQVLTQPTRLRAMGTERVIGNVFFDGYPTLSTTAGEVGGGFMLRASGSW